MTTQSQTADKLFGAIKQNPEGLLLLAAGAALLLRAGSAAKSTVERYPGTAGSSGLADAASAATDYVSDAAGQAKQVVTDYASSVGSSIKDAGENAANRSQQAFGNVQATAQSGFDRILSEQPLAIAIAGLGIGVALAAAFPATDLERDTLGQTGAEIKQAAGQIAGRIKHATGVAGEELKAQAEQRGISADGVKEAASTVADAFSGAMRESSKETSGHSSSGNNSNG
jgi:hypothetical protein